jgi:hypothetical protein
MTTPENGSLVLVRTITISRTCIASTPFFSKSLRRAPEGSSFWNSTAATAFKGSRQRR